MPFVNYRDTSLYSRTKQTSWYLKKLELIQIPPSNDDTPLKITSKFHQRPDLLSFELYGTVDFWWIFSVRNKNEIEDPIHDLKTDLEIMVPTKERIEDIVK